ncbi:hypothetical protein [Acinetobacter thermotolerans]|uniref:hypothetical protein n=1 Tax=Acinetobacter thermotolerans TaxID=3151487 RepID=UPI00325BC10A
MTNKRNSRQILPVVFSLFMVSGLSVAAMLQPAKTPIEQQPAQVTVQANHWTLKSNHCSEATCHAQVQGDDFVVFVEYQPGLHAEPVWVTLNEEAVDDFYIDSDEFSRIAAVVGV